MYRKWRFGDDINHHIYSWQFQQLANTVKKPHPKIKDAGPLQH